MAANLIIIAGTNGVGKSFYGNYLNKHYDIPFINTDEFYKNLFGSLREYSHEELKTGTAGIHRLQNSFFEKKQTFAVERILNNEGEVNNLIDRAKSYNFQISLAYIGVGSIDLSKRRVEQRFFEGGHNVELELIKKNLDLSIKNFKDVSLRADNIVLYDNSKTDNKYKKLMDIREGKIHFQAKSLPIWAEPFVETIKKKISQSLSDRLQDFKTTAQNQNTKTKQEKER